MMLRPVDFEKVIQGRGWLNDGWFYFRNSHELVSGLLAVLVFAIHLAFV